MKIGLGDTRNLNETQRPLAQLRSGKRTGVDGIPSEVPKSGAPEMPHGLHYLVGGVFPEEQVPAELNDARVLAPNKGKVSKQLANNFRGINLRGDNDSSHPAG